MAINPDNKQAETPYISLLYLKFNLVESGWIIVNPWKSKSLFSMCFCPSFSCFNTPIFCHPKWSPTPRQVAMVWPPHWSRSEWYLGPKKGLGRNHRTDWDQFFSGVENKLVLKRNGGMGFWIWDDLGLKKIINWINCVHFHLSACDDELLDPVWRKIHHLVG